MAEQAAHHTGTVVSCPTIFEVIAQENLSASCSPALKKLITFIVLKQPEQLKWLIQYVDEVFLVLNTVCQYRYLKKYGGTFSENFYGITRVSSIDNSKLSNNQLYINLALVVIVPYLREKCVAYVDQLEIKSKLQLKEKVFLQLNTIVRTGWEALCLVYYIKYISGSSKTYSPLLDIAGSILTYKVDLFSHDEDFNNVSFKELIKKYLYYGLTHSLEMGAFFVQFLDWWHIENLHSKFVAYPIPNPPMYNDKYSNLKNMNKCPICMKERKMPTALTVSGFVFCYKCLHQSLMVESRCPVTKLPATMQDMVRIYSDS